MSFARLLLSSVSVPFPAPSGLLSAAALLACWAGCMPCLPREGHSEENARDAPPAFVALPGFAESACTASRVSDRASRVFL